MFFLTLFLWAAAFVLSEVLRPAPKIENARPAHLGDFNFPTATEGRIIPLIWGTVKVEGPNVIWYGDLITDARKKKVKTGLFSSKKVTTGYKYFVGMQLGLCRGEVDSIKKLWIGDKLAFSGNATSNIVLDDEEFFGGSDVGGSGGIAGTLRIYRGTTSQGINGYLSGVADFVRQRYVSATINTAGSGYVVGDILQFSGGTFDARVTIKVETIGVGGAIATWSVVSKGIYSAVPTDPVSAAGGTGTLATFNVTWEEFSMLPAHRGTCHVVWEQGYIGDSSQIQPWKFEIRRVDVTNFLSLGSGHEVVNGVDANPMNVLYEILTDVDWGLAQNAGDIDTTSFTDAATVLYNEGNGISMLIDSPLECSELIKEIERQIDGYLYVDRTTGKWKITLVRGGYDPDAMPVADESNIIEVKEFTRGAWEETSNNVRVEFSNRGNDYGVTYALAQDSANIRLQSNAVVSVTNSYPGCKHTTLATNLAWRDLRGLAYPLAKATWDVDRSFHALNPGDVVIWSDSSLDVDELAMRVTRVDLGKLDAGIISLNLVQDIFYYDANPAFASVPNTHWVLPQDSDPVDIEAADRKIFEAPKAFCDRAEENAGIFDRIWVGARYPEDHSTGFEIWSKVGSEEYAAAGETQGYLLLGKLNTTIAQTTAQGSTTIVIDPDPDTLEDIVAALENRSVPEIGKQLHNLILINNEFFGFQTVTNTDPTITLTGVYRALLDTVPVTHSSTANVWLVCVAGNVTDSSYNAGDTVDVKLLTSASGGTLALADATASSVTMDNRARRPYPPSIVELQDVSGWTTTASLDYQTGATLDTEGLQIHWNRKDFRTHDEVKAVVDDTTLAGDFPDANITEYRVSIYNDPAGDNTLVYQSDWLDGDTGDHFVSRAKLLGAILEDPAGGASTLFTEDFSAATGKLSSTDWDVRSGGTGGWTSDSPTHSHTDESMEKVTISGSTMLSALDGYTNDGHTLFNVNQAAVLKTVTTAGADYLVRAVVRLHDNYSSGGSPMLAIDDRINTSTYSATQGGRFMISLDKYMFMYQSSGWVDEDGNAVFTPLTFSTPLSNSTTHTVEYIRRGDHYEATVNGTSIRSYTRPNTHGTNTGIGLSMLGYTVTPADKIGFVSIEVVALGLAPTPGALPTTLRIVIETRHIYGGLTTYTSSQQLDYSFDVTTPKYTGLSSLGSVEPRQVTALYTALGTSTHTLFIGTALGYNIQYSKNGGAFTNIITAGNTSGTVALTAADTIQFKLDAPSAVTTDNATSMEFKDGGSTLRAYGVQRY